MLIDVAVLFFYFIIVVLVPRLNFAMIFVDLQQRQQQQQPLYLYSARNRMNKNIKVKIKRVHGYPKYYTRGNLVSAKQAMESIFSFRCVFMAQISSIYVCFPTFFFSDDFFLLLSQY